MATNKKAAVSITTKDLTKSFGDHLVLNQLNLQVQPGEIFVVMGPSGTGKSVLLKLLAGLEQPTSGEIEINHIPLKEVRKIKKYVLGLVFQAGALFNSLSVFDNLALYFREHALYNEAEIDKRVTRILNLLHLESARFLMPADLSGGMKKRVALARGLLMEPDVLLFDEPTSELDPITGASIIELIGYVNKHFGITTIIVTHDIMLAKSIGNHICVLQNGRIDDCYTPETLLLSKNTFVQDFLNPKINQNALQFKNLLS